MTEQFKFNQLDDSADAGNTASKVDVAHVAPKPDRSGAPPAPAPVEPANREIHLNDYLKVVYKRRYLALTAFAVVMVATLVYTFTAKAVYQAHTRLLIEAENPNVVSFKEVIDEQQARSDYYQTQYNILQSRALARRTLDAAKLWPRFMPKEEDAGSGATKGVASVFAWVTTLFRGSEPGAAKFDETVAESRAIDAFLGGLSVAPIRNSRLVDVRYASGDPYLATMIVNSLAQRYIDQNLEYKFLASKDASDFLTQQLEKQRQAVEAAEAALQNYREQNGAISFSDRENIVVQKLSDLNAAATRAKTTRLEKEALYNQLKDNQNNASALDTFPAILGNSFIQQLKSQLSDLTRRQAQMSERLLDGHPDMIAIKSEIQTTNNKLTAEIAKIVQSVRSEYQAALDQEQSLTRALDQQKGEALSMNKRAGEYSVLQRDVDSSKQVYDTLLQRAKETGVAGALKTSNVRIVDAAERPRSPISPNRRLNVVLGLLFGLMSGVGVALFFDYMDDRVRTPEEIRSHLGLAWLGLLPAVPKGTVEGAPVLVTKPVPMSFSESLRSLRTSVLFSFAPEGARLVAITSSGPGEGKTLVATNLAAGIAQAGQRVLLIDADMRKPRVHQVFGGVQSPGLSDVLVGQSKANDAVRVTDTPGLWLLPAGTIPPNPAELLASPRFREFLNSAARHFDWILVDTPPVMAVTDACVVAHSTGHVIFVIGSEMTSRQVVRTAIDQLKVSSATVLGAVLNKVNLTGDPYYYRQYYRREYAKYYHDKAG